MKVLLIKSGRANLFLRAYCYLKENFGKIDVAAKKDTVCQLDSDTKFEYDCRILSKKLLKFELKELKDKKYEKIFFIMQNDNFFIEYKNIYSFSRCLNPKNIVCLNSALFKQPIKSWFHFYYLALSKIIFRYFFKTVFFSVYIISKIFKKFTHKLIIERPNR
ncbi:hypothetical protein J7L67_02800 [bacterium]|nr:hypothetical protein [bacterium]